ncbi:MAG: GEVED domain-containing protein [Pirellulales bacterium]
MSARPIRQRKSSQKRSSQHLKNRRARVRTSRVEMLEDRRMLATDLVSIADPFVLQEPNNQSTSPSISADGRFVTYQSNASNLVAGDTNGADDIFVFDRQINMTTRVSVDSAGNQSIYGYSSNPSISADGRFITYQSNAYNLVAGDTNGMTDVFVFDRDTNTTTRVSVDSAGTEANNQSSAPSISADGLFITYTSSASNLVAGDTNGTTDVFILDRDTNMTTRVSVDSAGTEANNASTSPSISADGLFITYSSRASNLVAGDTNGTDDVFLLDRATNTTTRVSVDSVGNQVNGYSYSPSISADGQFVTYSSSASNLVAGDTNGKDDVFLMDRDTNTTTRVSVDSAGTEANDYSYSPSISADGLFITYFSYASNLVAGDTNGNWDIFVLDRDMNTTTRVSVDSAGAEANNHSYIPSLSADGRFVTYQSNASNLVAGDNNGTFSDVFVSDMVAAPPLVDRDFGDAPNSYGTLDSSLGASHGSRGPQLGFLRDTETDGQPSVDALADAADEDGVTFTTLVAGQFSNNTIEMTGGPAFIDAWVDFNADGDWDDVGEQIFISASVNDGLQALLFLVPETATLGNTYARFRISSNGGLDPTGFDRDGEVEDYLINITQALEVDLPSGNGADDVTVRLNSGNIEVYDNNGSSVITSSPLADTHAVIINGAAAEDDKVTVDYDTGGFFSLLGGIEFNGGTGGTDALIIQGTGATESEFASVDGTLGNASVLTSEAGQRNLVAFNNIEPLSALGLLTFTAEGSVYVGANSLTVESVSQLGLESLTTLGGGTIVAASGIALGNGQLISGTGQINGPIASAFGSTIHLTGNLTLGDAASAAGYFSNGHLIIDANTATINDVNEAVLGSLTTLGTAGADGSLNAPTERYWRKARTCKVAEL